MSDETEIKPIIDIFNVDIRDKKKFDEDGNEYHETTFLFYTGLEPMEGYPKAHLIVSGNEKLKIDIIEE